MRVALYARISTNDGRQHLENQLDELRRYVDGRAPKWTIAGEYTDRQTGAADKRPGLEKLISDAAQEGFSLVIVWDLSRLTRGGPAKAFEYIERLKKWGVEFWSLKEPHFRTSGPTGEVFIALAAHIAREERRQIVERIKAGMDRARKAGKVFGAPRRSLDPGRLLRYIEEGKTIRQISRIEKVPPSTVHRHLKGLKNGPKKTPDTSAAE